MKPNQLKLDGDDDDRDDFLGSYIKNQHAHSSFGDIYKFKDEILDDDDKESRKYD